jgi:hypothetical protein
VDTDSKNRPRWEQFARAGTREHRATGRRPDRTGPQLSGWLLARLRLRLTLAGGRRTFGHRTFGHRVFVKVMDAATWPWDAALHRAEARTAAALPAAVPAPRLIGCHG